MLQVVIINQLDVAGRHNVPDHDHVAGRDHVADHDYVPDHDHSLKLDLQLCDDWPHHLDMQPITTFDMIANCFICLVSFSVLVFPLFACAVPTPNPMNFFVHDTNLKPTRA